MSVQSIKLSVTCGKRLERKYGAAGLERIREAIAAWVAGDEERRTLHVELDDPKAMERYGLSAIAGRPTAKQVKAKLDALVARLAPDYVVLIGAGDVVPMFEVPNPTAGEDDEPAVPTDNPYACSRRFDVKQRASYLVPDRVVGRIPDLVAADGAGDPAWLCGYLAAARSARPAGAKSYSAILAACCHAWRRSGKRCVEYIGRDPKDLLVSPPAKAASAGLKGRHARRLHLIKCHGAAEDARFYGQKGAQYPEVLTSTSLVGRTRRGTVVGAMCCYGANVFDPGSETAIHPGEPPIASVYLKQGAHGFFGATNTAWVGPETMLCADWLVAAFLKGVLGGASLGRAALEAKQDFVRWNQQQGSEVDSADEKTLLQFVLLGDPAIHPVAAPVPAELPAAAAAAVASSARARPAVVARKQRRAARHRLGELLRSALPARVKLRGASVPARVRALARACVRADGKGFRLRAKPVVQRLERRIARPELAPRAARAAAARGVPVAAAPALERRLYEYSFAARRKAGRLVEIRLVSIQADAAGNPVRVQVLASGRAAR
jgi:hypothetical protein